MNPAPAVVLGGGISGLVAAYRLLRAGVPVTLVEADDRVGGTLAWADVHGATVDVGAEAFVVRRPEVLSLAAELGIADRIVHPVGRRPSLWVHGAITDLPRPTLMGIPTSIEAAQAVVEPDDLERMRAEPDRELVWTTGGDVSLGEFVADRFGRSVVDRCVDPMLAGVYSSRSDDIGLRAAIPALAEHLDAGATSLTAAVAGITQTVVQGPVFGTFDGGYRVLIESLREQLGDRIRTGVTVRSVHPDGSGFRVDTTRGSIEASAVVSALIAPVAAEVMRPCAPDSADLLGAVEIAKSSVVTLAVAPEIALPDRSGVLVASGEGLRAKAFTFSTQKWSHIASEDHVLRVSFGRYGAEVNDVSDADLVEWAMTDVATVIGCSLDGAVREAVVTRWDSGIPRYAPGHAAVIERLDAACPPSIAFAGAAFDGVGVPACIARATAAAERIATTGKMNT